MPDLDFSGLFDALTEEMKEIEEREENNKMITNCPNCGAPLSPNGHCEYCGTYTRNIIPPRSFNQRSNPRRKTYHSSYFYSEHEKENENLKNELYSLLPHDKDLTMNEIEKILINSDLEYLSTQRLAYLLRAMIIDKRVLKTSKRERGFFNWYHKIDVVAYRLI